MNRKTDTSMRSSNVVACIWDFDKTLIPAYMQTPIFKEYDVDEKTFWREVNMLPKIYAERGIRVSPARKYFLPTESRACRIAGAYGNGVIELCFL